MLSNISKNYNEDKYADWLYYWILKLIKKPKIYLEVLTNVFKGCIIFF